MPEESNMLETINKFQTAFSFYSSKLQKFSFMTKQQLPNVQQTVANTILIINISNSNNLNKFWVGIFSCCDIIKQLASFPDIKFTKQEWRTQLATSIANDRTRVR